MKADETVEMKDASTDQMLGGRIVLHQAQNGYRVAIDPVFLAAAIPARAGETVLDAGCGTAAASLCLVARIPGVSVMGLELQPEMIRLAMENVEANAMAERIGIVQGDIARPPPDIHERHFDHVMANPPYMQAHTGNPPPDPVRATAMVEGDGGVAVWVSFAASVLKPKGSLTLVHRAERLTCILTAMGGRFGDIRVFPLWPGPGMDKPAKRVLVQARKGINTPLRLLPGLILHQEDGQFTHDANNVLRDAAPLTL